MKTPQATVAAPQESLKNQGWEVTAVSSSILPKLIEEGWFSRPEGQTMADNLSDQPSPMQSLYQSHLPLEQERGQMLEQGREEGLGKEAKAEFAKEIGIEIAKTSTGLDI